MKKTVDKKIHKVKYFYDQKSSPLCSVYARAHACSSILDLKIHPDTILRSAKDNGVSALQAISSGVMYYNTEYFFRQKKIKTETLYDTLVDTPVVAGILLFKEVNLKKKTISLPKPEILNILTPPNSTGKHAICLAGLDRLKSIVYFVNSWGLGVVQSMPMALLAKMLYKSSQTAIFFKSKNP